MTSRLMTPGPTPVPREAAEAMARPLIHHRTVAFRELLVRVRDRLAEVFRTRGEVALLTASGSGAMEAAVVNMCRAGDRVLVASCGKFGDRWARIAEAHGLDVVHERCAPGESFAVDRFTGLLRDRGPFAVAFVTASETSTGVGCDLEGMGRAVRDSGTLLVADTITALAALPVETDVWGVDAAVGASQKAFGVPPGLSFVALGARAVDRVMSEPEGEGLPRFYFDLRSEIPRQREGQTAFTPAITLVTAMAAVLGRLEGDGLAAQIAATARRARATRAAVEALGLELLAKHRPSDALTAMWLPEGVDGVALLGRIESRAGIRLAGGQGELKGRIVRIAHLGFIDDTDTVEAIGALEEAIAEAGGDIRKGAGVARARELLGGGS